MRGKEAQENTLAKSGISGNGIGRVRITEELKRIVEMSKEKKDKRQILTHVKKKTEKNEAG